MGGKKAPGRPHSKAGGKAEPAKGKDVKPREPVMSAQEAKRQEKERRARMRLLLSPFCFFL